MNVSTDGNLTTEFTLLGFSDDPTIHRLLFVLFLIMFMTTFIGDIYIMMLVSLDPKLHNPMYFFLANFSFVDICLTSIVVPQFLINLISGRKTISFDCCVTQLFFFMVAVNLECLLLTVMGYDRYVAICVPLRYAQIMSKKVCGLLVIIPYLIGVLHSLLYTVMLSQFSFCASRQIHHFFCDLPPLLKLSCSDISTYQLLEYTEGVAIFLSPFVFLITSYSRVIFNILKIRSAEGRRKAFSTCSSHLILVGLLYSSMFFMYYKPVATDSLDYDRVVSVVYTVVIPMLNPFIYSLWNKDMKSSLRKLLERWSTWRPRL